MAGERFQKPTITADRIAWFAAYFRRHPTSEIFHGALADRNYACGVGAATWAGGRADAVDREAAAWFNTLSPTQRKRLGQKAEDLADTIVREVQS